MESKDRLEGLKRRIEKLQDRIRLQKVGSDVENARRLLVGLQAKYEILTKDAGAFIPEATSSKRSDGISEEELSQRLGTIFWIFGPSYEETFSFHTYRIEFLYTEQNNSRDCFMTVIANIWEDDEILIKEAKIDFWRLWEDCDEVDDIGISCSDEANRYKHHFHWFSPLKYSLATTWNQYFKKVPKLESKTGGYLDAGL